MPRPRESRQVVIIHLSDIHFGRNHTFNSPTSARGDRPVERGYPTLLDKLKDDLALDDPGCPVLVAITGDMAETGAYEELAQAESFIKGLTEFPILGARRALKHIVFVPGNHDVSFDKADIGQRWQQWTDFHNRLRGTRVRREEPWALDAVDEQIEDLGAVVVCVNSAIWVQKDTDDEDRGRVDQSQIAEIEERLREIDPARLRSAIRVALIHHHPVLTPSLTEAGRGDDAIHNSALLLALLREFGFHVILHGHKHNPFVFTEDAISAYRTDEPNPILIAAGGSVGSRKLPSSPLCGNCYNRLVVKWDAAANQARINVTTRGLRVRGTRGNDLLARNWSWQTLREDDRQFIGGDSVPIPRAPQERKREKDKNTPRRDATRVAEYARTHGCFPVVAVMPSLDPDQRNEARLWIERHAPSDGSDSGGPAIVSVTWSAGPNFPMVVTVDAEDDPRLCAVCQYYGPMLVQAEMHFNDGDVAVAHVYVRIPQALGPP